MPTNNYNNTGGFGYEPTTIHGSNSIHV